MHTVELRIRIQNPNRYRNQDQNTQSEGLSFCQLVAIYSNRLSKEKASRWMLVSDACNDAAHEVIGKPKPVQPYSTILYHTMAYHTIRDQAKKVANWVAPINLLLLPLLPLESVSKAGAQLSRSELKSVKLRPDGGLEDWRTDGLTDGLLCRLWHLIDANRIDLQSLHSGPADGKKNHSSLVLRTNIRFRSPSRSRSGPGKLVSVPKRGEARKGDMVEYRYQIANRGFQLPQVDKWLLNANARRAATKKKKKNRMCSSKNVKL